MKVNLFRTKLKGATLQEVLVALVIVGIIAAIAIPSYNIYVTNAKMSEAKDHLTFLHTLEKTYHMEHSKYSDDLKTLGFEQAKLVTEDGKANYKIEIVQAAAGTFLARATSVTDFDNDGVFNVWEIDQDKNLVKVQED
jgi:type IV pilus assembly protein PilE